MSAILDAIAIHANMCEGNSFFVLDLGVKHMQHTRLLIGGSFSANVGRSVLLADLPSDYTAGTLGIGSIGQYVQVRQHKILVEVPCRDP
eukprot:5340209-Amphidinium_carterae.1